MNLRRIFAVKTLHARLQPHPLYRPLKVTLRSSHGLYESLEDMRLPFNPGYTLDRLKPIPDEDLRRAAKLVLAGDDHAKAMRGIMVWLRLEMQVGWMIEFETYRHGVECLSTSSSMHTELKNLKGADLAEAKQAGLSNRVYRRGVMLSYQALRHIYMARQHHRHPDWQIFCQMIEKLPFFEYLIYPEKQANLQP